MPATSRYTAPWNLTGQPTISVPARLSGDGLPVSIEIVGRPFDEETVLRIARLRARHPLAHPSPRTDNWDGRGGPRARPCRTTTSETEASMELSGKTAIM